MREPCASPAVTVARVRVRVCRKQQQLGSRCVNECVWAFPEDLFFFSFWQWVERELQECVRVRASNRTITFRRETNQ